MTIVYGTAVFLYSNSIKQTTENDTLSFSFYFGYKQSHWLRYIDFSFKDTVFLYIASGLYYGLH